MGEISPKIFLFVPNLIGYVRIVLFLISFYYMPFDYIKAAACYSLSVLLDEVDGYFARLCNQETRFGEMLDILTDQVGAVCFVTSLASFYPEYMLLFQMSIAIDVASHWIYSHSCVLQGSGNHKDVDVRSNPVIRFYYTSKPFLTFMCIGNQLFFVMLYLLHFTEGAMIPGLDISIIRLILYISTPIMVVKAIISLVHLVDASISLANIDVTERSKKM